MTQKEIDQIDDFIVKYGCPELGSFPERLMDFINTHLKEPASEELERAAEKYEHNRVYEEEMERYANYLENLEEDETPRMKEPSPDTKYFLNADIIDAFKAGAQWQKERDESDDELCAIHFEKWNITGECPSELEAKIDAKFGITGRDSNGNPSNGYCDWKKDVFTNGASIYSFVKLGMDYQREQMIKDAIEGFVEKHDGHFWINFNIPQLQEVLSHYEKDENIKIIVLPSNNK